jgi:hypothetical protein
MLCLLWTSMTFSCFHAMIVLQGGGPMQFGFLNLTGFLIVALMMIPNLIYARRNPHIENQCFCKPMLILEQIGRYGSMSFSASLSKAAFASVRTSPGDGWENVLL